MTDALLPTTGRTLLHRIATAQVQGRAPSMVGAVARDGALLWSGGRGIVDGEPPTSDTQYRIGSLSKTFAAVLIMRLRDEGRVDLGDPLERHLPGTPIGQLTIAQLLAHTSGLASETPPPWWERSTGDVRPELADVLDEPPSRHPAGRRFHYSNPGFAIVGGLAEQLCGRPWGELVREEILTPLGMRRTTLMPEPPHALGWATHPWADLLLSEPTPFTGRMAPAGQLWSTATDLARFGALLAGQREHVLAADTVAEMRELASAPTDEKWDTGYGLGVQLMRTAERTLHGHTGSMPGFLATLWVDPDQDLTGIAFANVTNGPAIGTVAADLIGIVAEHEPRIPDAWAPLSDLDPDLLALTGPWYWGATAVAVQLRAEREVELTTLGAYARASRFRPADDGTWVGLDGYYNGEILRVVRDASGGISHLDIGSFVYTRAPYDPAAPVPGGVDADGWRPAAQE